MCMSFMFMFDSELYTLWTLILQVSRSSEVLNFKCRVTRFSECCVKIHFVTAIFLLTKKHTLVMTFNSSMRFVFKYSNLNLSLIEWCVIDENELIHDFCMTIMLCCHVVEFLSKIVITMFLNLMQLYWSIDKQLISWLITVLLEYTVHLAVVACSL